MAWVEKLPSGKYRAVWRDSQGRQRSRSPFTQKAEAARYAGEQETLARTGRASYQGRSLPWGRWADQWLERRRVEASTQSSDRPRIEKWLRPQWDRLPITRITTADVQDWVNDLADEMAPASVEKCYRLFSASMKAAQGAGLVVVSPCEGIVLPTVPPPDERFLTRGEFDSAAFHLVEPYRTGAIILVGTGLRFGEMAGLHHHRIDWEAQAIDVHETLTVGDDGRWRIKAYPKGRQKRRVPMPSWVGEAILQLGTSQRRTCGVTHARGSRCRSGLVLYGPEGAPLNARNMLRRHWAPALQRAGLDHARQHDLRHTTASWLIQNGCSLTDVAAILGHTEPAVSARYAHLAGAHMDRVRAVLEGV